MTESERRRDDSPVSPAPHACPRGLAFTRNAYFRVMRFRDACFHPLTGLLAALRVTPNTLSYTGVAVMIAFAFMAGEDARRALVLLVVAFTLDLADGALARRLRCDTDRGKFTDMFCDSLVFTLFLAGLVQAGLLAPLAGLGVAYAMLLSKVFRAVRNAVFLETDWHFKAVAGFVPNSLVGLFYLLFIVYAATGNNLFPVVAVPAVALLVADIGYFYHRIMTLLVPAKTQGRDSP